MDCHPSEDAAGPFFEGLTEADVTIDESGHVSDIALIQSVGNAKEAAVIASMKACSFSPATIGGEPFASHTRLKIRWTKE